MLPEHVASDPDLKQRFEREARTVAALNHPHICTLHDIGSQDGIDFLVMEYLDGQTVAQRLEKGALPLDQALQIAIDIADALDKAHRQGIVHRDLKPANIMLTKAGAKLLDFGLAKLKPPEQAGGLSALPTQPADLTQQGAILGTFQYMAPEQLEGQEVDARTDIFTLGAVIYEMVAGRKAFEGKSQASLIHEIMGVEPPLMSSLQVMSPPTLDQIVRTCLAKVPDDRWQTAGDVGRQLKWVVEGASQVGVPAPVSARRKTRERLSGALIGAMIATVATGGAVWSLMRSPQMATGLVKRTAVTLEEPYSLAFADLMPLGIGRRSIALSPDGTQLVYVADLGGQSQLFLRPMDDFEARPLAGTEGGFQPFFSPDGEWIGFSTPTELRKVSVRGGAPITLCSAGNVYGAAWGPDNTIVFAEQEGRQLSRVSANGGSQEVLFRATPTSGTFAFPQFLPEARSVLVTVRGGDSAWVWSRSTLASCAFCWSGAAMLCTCRLATLFTRVTLECWLCLSISPR